MHLGDAEISEIKDEFEGLDYLVPQPLDGAPEPLAEVHHIMNTPERYRAVQSGTREMVSKVRWTERASEG